MLQGILFDLAPEAAETQAVRALLNTLKKTGIKYILSSEIPFPHTASALLQSLGLPLENCLVLTDSAAGIVSARTAGLPCIGYAPPETKEDMSGAYALSEDFAAIDIAYLCRTHAHAVGYPADILSTERLVVREFSEEDFPVLYAICTEPSTASFMEESFSDYDTESEKHYAYIRNVYPFFDLALWGVYEKASGKLIGRAGFSLPKDDSDTFSIGYLIDVPYRRQGFAKELIPALLSYAKEQGYTKISARIKSENDASVKSLEQCGFPFKRKDAPPEEIILYVIDLTA